MSYFDLAYSLDGSGDKYFQDRNGEIVRCPVLVGPIEGNEAKLSSFILDISVSPNGMSEQEASSFIIFCAEYAGLGINLGKNLIRERVISKRCIRMCEQIIVLGQYVFRHYPDSLVALGYHLDMILVACIVTDRLEYFKLFYQKIHDARHFDLFLRYAVYEKSWECANYLIDLMNDGNSIDSACHRALEVLASFSNGNSFDQMGEWISKLLDKVTKLSYRLIWNIISIHFNRIREHVIWDLIPTESLELLFSDMVHSQISIQNKILEFIINRKNSEFKSNSSYMISALDAGKVSAIRMLLRVGAKSVGPERAYVVNDHPRAKRIKLLEAIGIESEG
jgi:hypothetical protein